MMPSDVLQQMRILLGQLSKIDFGYPIGENVIRSVEEPACVRSALSELGECGARWLSPLYLACDGLSFPDVHVGYFLKPIKRVISFDRSSEPDTVILEREIPVLPIGSTGGGSLFVVDCEKGRVMLLPPGPLKEGRYDGRDTKVRDIATSVSQFLELLLADLSAFVNDDRRHIFLATG